MSVLVLTKRVCEVLFVIVEPSELEGGKGIVTFQNLGKHYVRKGRANLGGKSLLGQQLGHRILRENHVQILSEGKFGAVDLLQLLKMLLTALICILEYLVLRIDFLLNLCEVALLQVSFVLNKILNLIVIVLFLHGLHLELPKVRFIQSLVLFVFLQNRLEQRFKGTEL